MSRPIRLFRLEYFGYDPYSVHTEYGMHTMSQLPIHHVARTEKIGSIIPVSILYLRYTTYCHARDRQSG